MNVYPLGQGWVTQDPALKEIEKRVKDHALAHDGNPMARRHAEAARVAVDAKENYSLNKKLARRKIDAIAAMVGCVYSWMRIPADKAEPSMYETARFKAF